MGLQKKAVRRQLKPQHLLQFLRAWRGLYPQRKDKHVKMVDFKFSRDRILHGHAEAPIRIFFDGPWESPYIVNA